MSDYTGPYHLADGVAREMSHNPPDPKNFTPHPGWLARDVAASKESIAKWMIDQLRYKTPNRLFGIRVNDAGEAV